VSSPATVEELQAELEKAFYFADRTLATALFLGLSLRKPVLLEGEPGVGKTGVAGVLAERLGRRLIRLQCYEGLDASSALYEWDYARQLLELRLLEAAGGVDPERARRQLFGRDFLLARPLLEALETPAGTEPPVLLIDEIDRADEEFEAFLLEILGDFQVSIPELGTVRAARPPFVVLTSNRSREIHDALRRRCLYHWIDLPTFERELAIVRAKVPGAEERLLRQAVRFVQRLRQEELAKRPGVAETLDWLQALVALGRRELDAAALADTRGALIKLQEDLELLDEHRVGSVLAEACSG